MLQMITVSVVLIAVCFGICWKKIWLKSKANIEKGIVDNGAQLAVTVGVIFTFIGITIGLLNFNTDSTKMADNINLFLEGMKTAFVTSIIGMIFGIYIKWKQSEVEQKDDITLKEILHENIGNISKKLNDIKNSIDANSNNTLQREINNLITAMKNFIQASNSSREDMKALSDSMENQVESVNNLGVVFTRNIQEISNKFILANERQAEKFKEAIDNLSDSQKKTLENLSEKLSDKLKSFDENQITRLDKMNETIEKMLYLTEQAKQNSENLLKETNIYQQQSLANDETQARILSENTAQISAMKNSFDEFLQKLSERYSQALIDALRQSIEQLNVQLQDQFGDNFKELNHAVEKIVEWQENYKITVEKTTGELEQFNTAFETFSEKIASQVDTHIESMTANIKIFSETSKENVAVQKNLNDVVISLSQVVQDSKESVKEMHKLTQSFEAFSNDVIKQNKFAIENYKNIITKNLESVAQANEKFADEIKKLRNTALTVRTDTEQNIKEFGDASKKAIGEIRKTLETFNTDFSKETKTSLENLQKVFNQISKNTEKQSGDAVATLAGSLSAITDQMIGNYNALIVRIAELDALIRKEDDKK